MAKPTITQEYKARWLLYTYLIVLFGFRKCGKASQSPFSEIISSEMRKSVSKPVFGVRKCGKAPVHKIYIHTDISSRYGIYHTIPYW
jgi:hypothetical protein